MAEGSGWVRREGDLYVMPVRVYRFLVLVAMTTGVAMALFVVGLVWAVRRG